MLFYCLSPCQIITSIGVVEAVYSNMQDSEQIFNLVAKRTVYPKNEIEEMEKTLSESGSVLKTTKRKKDGVFYTPKYITQYIVENTENL